MSFSGALKFFDGNGSKMSNEDDDNSSFVSHQDKRGSAQSVCKYTKIYLLSACKNFVQ